MASSMSTVSTGCWPVMPVVRLSMMRRVTLALARAKEVKPGSPEWTKVESPITATAGWRPAKAAPSAMPTEAPISTQACMAS